MNLGGRQTRREGLGAGGDEHQDKHDTGGRRGERHRPETLALVLTLRRPHVTEKHQTGKDTRGRALCGNAETHTDTSTGEARGTRGRQTQERRRAAGGPGRAGADTRRPRSCQSAPARPPPPARAHLGPLTPRSGGSWQAAPCPRSASVSRGACRASGGGRGAALGHTRGRTEGRTSTAPPPRRLGGARRAGRGRGAAERTGSNRRRRRTGSGSDPATRPAVVCAIATS